MLSKEKKMIYLIIGLVICAFLLILLVLLYGEAKNENFRLEKTNNSLIEEVTSYKARNSQLSFKINELSTITEEQKAELDTLLADKEIFKFKVESKVKWLDSHGETEYGIVCDDFFSEGKHFVVVRGINKKGKVTGRYFTVSAQKISID